MSDLQNGLAGLRSAAAAAQPRPHGGSASSFSVSVEDLAQVKLRRRSPVARPQKRQATEELFRAKEKLRHTGRCNGAMRPKSGGGADHLVKQAVATKQNKLESGAKAGRSRQRTGQCENDCGAAGKENHSSAWIEAWMFS